MHPLGENLEQIFVGEYRVIPATNTLIDSKGNESVHSQLTFSLLLKLIEHAPETVSQKDIIKSVWNNHHVSDETLQQRIKLLRQALNDNSSSPSYIVTVRNKGYKLIAPVQKRTVPLGSRRRTNNTVKFWKVSAIILAAVLTSLLFIMYKQEYFSYGVNPNNQIVTPMNSNKVLFVPFKSIHPDETNSNFAEGLSKQLGLALSYIERIHLIDQTRFSNYELENKSALQLAKEQKAGYVIFGDVERKNKLIQVHVAMQNVISEEYIWTKTIKVEFKDIFKTQNKLVQEIADSLNLRLDPIAKKMLAQPTENITAYDYTLKADSYLRRMQKSDNEIAMQLSQKAIELDPQLASAHYVLGLAYIFQQSNWDGPLHLLDDAIKEAEFIIKLNPDNSQGHFLLGLAYRHKGWNEVGDWSQKGIRAYEKALEVDPNNINAKNALIDYYFRYKQFGKVLKTLYESLQNKPDSIFIYQRIGYVFEELNYNDIAIQWYKKGLEIKPDSYNVIMNLSELYQSLGDYSIAMKYANQALERYPNHSYYLFQKADIYFFQNNLKDAEYYYDKAISSLNPGYDFEHGYYLTAYINLCSLYMTTGRSEKAQNLLDKLKQVINSELLRYPDFKPDYLSNLAMIEALKGNNSLAKKLLVDAVDAGFLSDDWLQVQPIFRTMLTNGDLQVVFDKIKGITEEYRLQIQESGILQNDIMQLNNNLIIK